MEKARKHFHLRPQTPTTTTPRRLQRLYTNRSSLKYNTGAASTTGWPSPNSPWPHTSDYWKSNHQPTPQNHITTTPSLWQLLHLRLSTSQSNYHTSTLNRNPRPTATILPQIYPPRTSPISNQPHHENLQHHMEQHNWRCLQTTRTQPTKTSFLRDSWSTTFQWWTWLHHKH